MSKSILTDDQKNEIIKMYLDGESANQISKIYPISSNAIYALLKRKNIPRRTYSEASRKYTLNENYFENIDSQNKAYFLGYLFADGYNNVERNCVELSCATQDKIMLEILNKEIGSNKPIRDVQNGDIQSNRIDWCSEKLCKDLEKLGCIQAKTMKIEMPLLSNELLRHFIRGYFDGDGCISYSYTKRNNMFKNGINSVVTIVGTENFCNSLKSFIQNELNIHTTILCRNPETNDIIKTIQLAGNQQVITFMEWMYKDANILMKRKKDKLDELKEILKNRQDILKEKREKQKLLKLSQIVESEDDRWKVRYWLTRDEVNCESRSRFTEEQAEFIKDKLLQDGNVISEDEIIKIYNYYRIKGFPYYEKDFESFKKGFKSISLVNDKKDIYYWDGFGTQFATQFHPHFFQCKKPNKLSAEELFNNDELFKVAIKKSICLNREVSDSSIRDICRNEKRSSRINNFPPRVVISILRDFYNAPVDVLDPCAGFSGRLLGCACSGVVKSYTGIDLSERTVEGLKETSEWINKIQNFDTDIYYGDCINEMNILNRKFDCVLTSPPFLDVEEYIGVSYETDYSRWIDSFVIPFANNCFSVLKESGRMFLYLEKIGKIDFPKDFCNIAKDIGFIVNDPIIFTMSYGENNRRDSASRIVEILSFSKGAKEKILNNVNNSILQCREKVLDL